MKAAILFLFIGGALAVEPTFDALRRNYPLYSDIGWDALVHREGLDSWLLQVTNKNTCAMRVSAAFTKAGKQISPGTCNWAGVRDRNRNPYIIRVATLRCYLQAQYGTDFDKTGTSAADFQGYRGIIVMQNCGWSDATGHVDLWDGSACVGNCGGASATYFTQCRSFGLYQF